MNRQDINPFQYNGTSGAVPRQTSIDREANARNSGETQARANRFVQIIRDCGVNGATWKEVQDLYRIHYKTELHHGQTSGILTPLHKDAQVFISPSIKRDGCYAYIHNKYKHLFDEENRYDTPVQTRSGIRRQALEKVLADLRQLTEQQNTLWYSEFSSIVEQIISNFDSAVTK